MKTGSVHHGEFVCCESVNLNRHGGWQRQWRIKDGVWL
jgi:hypothetical protein